MAESRISYLNRTFDEYKSSILDITQKYYSDIFANYNDASIGNWLMDIPADIADNLSYNIDRAYQETDIDCATSRESILNIARTNGLKIPGPKSAIVEVELSCKIPMNNSAVANSGNNLSRADENYLPIVRKGTMFSDGKTTFELVDDVNFADQFDSNGFSNRQIIAERNGNNTITSYTYKKKAIARAGQTKIYKKIISNNNIKPFMTITISDANITNIESIICKEGTQSSTTPNLYEFYVDNEKYYDKNGLPVERYFEVDNLSEQYRFGYVVDQNADGTFKNGQYYDPIWTVADKFTLTDEDGVPIIDETTGNIVEEPIRYAMKGQWKRLKNKFTTEFQDNGSIKITFGSGLRNYYGNIPEDASEFTKYMMSRMEANDYLGVLPSAGCTIYVLYHVGGGNMSNIGANTLNTITYLNITINGNCNDPNDDKKKITVKNTLRVTNPTPSYGGKDKPSNEEIKYLIKYNSSSQNRCVTLKDYYAQISKIHPKFGVPFRHSVVEENNKVVIYTLGLNYQGYLMPQLSEVVAENIKEYLKEYKCVNDFVEIRSGRVINLAFDINVFVDKAYDTSEVISRVISLVREYMDVRRHFMGEDIYLGDIEKEISKLDGIINLTSLRCYNKVGSTNGYSDDEITQSTIDKTSCYEIERAKKLGEGLSDNEIDLSASDKVLYGSVDTMFEVRYASDIQVRIKTR